MEDRKQDLLEGVRAYLRSRPGEAGDFLRAIADAMALYERAHEDKRDALADKAVLHVLRPDLVETRAVADLVDLMWLHYPSGRRAGLASVEKECWDLFAEKCRAQPLNFEWLATTRGAEAASWARRCGLAVSSSAEGA